MKKMLVIRKQTRLLALWAALIAVRLPLRAASAMTWYLEAFRTRLQTSVDSLHDSYE